MKKTIVLLSVFTLVSCGGQSDSPTQEISSSTEESVNLSPKVLGMDLKSFSKKGNKPNHMNSRYFTVVENRTEEGL